MTPRRKLILAVTAAAAVLVALRLLSGGGAGDGRGVASSRVTTTTVEESTTTEETTTTVTEPPLPAPPPPDTTVADPSARTLQTLEVGDCFSRSVDEEVVEVRLVPCEEPHTDEVYTVIVLKNPAGSRYPRNLDDQAENGCYEAFVTFVGREPEDSPYGYDWYIPTEAEWQAGARRIPCVITDPDGKPIRGSAADA